MTDKPLVMVVDDDVAVATSITNVINDTQKYEVITAHSAKEALGHLAKNKIMLGFQGNKIKLIILDIKMPEMDGLQLLEKIRKDYSKDIGIAMLTAYEDTDKWERATSGFVVNYIRKPLDRKELIETLDKFFSGKEGEMTLDVFDRHIQKREEFKEQKEN
ncbi:MAG: response regulator [Candidatus Saganbacteria bacterium]|nr:response regulator [Candidatus Saganbacteria bacterium]